MARPQRRRIDHMPAEVLEGCVVATVRELVGRGPHGATEVLLPSASCPPSKVTATRIEESVEHVVLVHWLAKVVKVAFTIDDE
eukprot:2983775-Lingulodinium_polyedra.AAC.1